MRKKLEISNNISSYSFDKNKIKSVYLNTKKNLNTILNNINKKKDFFSTLSKNFKLNFKNSEVKNLINLIILLLLEWVDQYSALKQSTHFYTKKLKKKLFFATT
jgi:hypothetical protein